MAIDRVLAFSTGIEDAATQRAVRALERAMNAANSSISALQSSSSSGGVPTTRLINTSAPLAGGGSLAADLTLSISPGSNGNVLSTVGGSVVWAAPSGGGVTSVTAGSSKVTASPTTGAVVVDVVPANFTGIPESGVTNLTTDLAAKVATAGHAATSLLGNSSGSVGSVADIVASGNDQFPLTASGTLAFADFPTQIARFLPAFGLFGDGSDGSLHFDGTTAVLGVSPDVNKRYVMAFDINATDCLIDATVVVIMSQIDNEKQGSTGGSGRAYRLFGTGTLTLNGQIRNAGNGNQSNSITGHGTANGLGAANTINSDTITVASGGLGSGSGAGAVGVGYNPHIWSTTSGGAGGAISTAAVTPSGNYVGGGGGGGTSFAGGAGGPITRTANTSGSARTYVALSTCRTINQTPFAMAGAAGGGGGYGGIINTAGGNGGGGGGVVWVAFTYMTGSGSFAVPGGDGFTGGTNGASGGGGGGGGSGGSVVLTTYTRLSGIPARIVSGGAGGAGGGTTGKAGASGAPGREYISSLA